MPIGTLLHFFVAGVQPLWEDPAFKDGGRFTLKVPKTHTSKYWEDLLLAMIGEQFTGADEVLGLVLSTKYNFDQIAVWHRRCDEKVVETLRKDISRFVDVTDIRIDNESFKEAMNAPKPTYNNYRGRGTNNFRGRGRGNRGGSQADDGLLFDRSGKQ